jgi:hypothetical protein
MEEVYAAASTSIPSSSATTTPAADGAEASAGLRREDVGDFLNAFMQNFGYSVLGNDTFYVF